MAVLTNKKKIVIKRYKPDINVGLTNAQVLERQKNKLNNKTKTKTSKTYLAIFISNIFTFFNLIWAIIFFALIFVGAYNNLLFIIPIICNTVISIIQEIKAKVTVEKLSLVSVPRVKTTRNGQEYEVFAESLLLDDIISLSVGNQIPADSIIMEGVLEVNESLLTGESRSIKKEVGDTILAGSFVISGTCKARINKIGKESYIQTIATEAKKFKSPNSNLLKDLNKIIKYIGLMIIPVGALMLINNYFAYSKNFNIAVAKTCGSLTGMVPAGMFLLITIALSVGVIKLAKKKTLVRELYSVEMLSRTNVLCLDKTGTITDGTMQVSEFIVLDEKYDFKDIIPSVLGAQPHNNSTANAMIEYFGAKGDRKVITNIPFSSERKYFACQLDGLGTYAIGAPEFVLDKIESGLKKLILTKTKEGKRVLVVANSNLNLVEERPKNMVPLAIICIEDHIREDAIETIKWFKENDVKIKIISGDNPQTVSSIAERVGVENAQLCVSLEGMSLQQVTAIAENFTVFGRVTPEQKHALIKSLKTKGYVVAMTGDGVNDTLALKEADCSIAMADGSEVARNIADLVLMDSKFSSLPAVVREGRQVVNNVQQSSTLFLMKTLCTILLSLFTIVTLTGYPFEPINLLLLELFVIGLPSVILALQPNNNLIKGDFIPVVLRKAIPRGLLLFFNVFFILILGRFNVLTAEEITTSTTLMLTIIGYINLFMLCIPFTKLKILCVIVSGLFLVLGIACLSSFFGITAFTWQNMLTMGLLLAVSLPLSIYSGKMEKWFINWFKKPKKDKIS